MMYRRVWLLAAAILLPCLARAAVDANAIVQQMRAALDRESSSLRRLTFKMSDDTGSAAPVTIGEARGRVGDATRIVAVVLSPPSLRGVSYLIERDRGDVDVRWVYLPTIGRVRKISAPEAYTAFLNSDFTYVDLGFVRTTSTFTALGQADEHGIPCQLVEGIPRENWAYARTVTCVAHADHLPVERKIYDGSNTLWKVETWSAPKPVAGVPTIFAISMQDVQARSRTDIDVTAVRYDAAVPPSLFEPANLGKAADDAIWQTLDAPAPKG